MFFLFYWRLPSGRQREKMKSKKTLSVIILSLILLLGWTAFSFCMKMAPDISGVGIGARPMGLGGAFVGVADDASAIFKNPAGIAFINRLSLVSMSTQLLTSIDYRVIGATYPTEYGIFGVGFVGASMPAGNYTYMSGGVTVEEGPILYENNLYILSWGVDISKGVGDAFFYDEDAVKYMGFGANLKVLSEGFTGSMRNAPSASGFQLDLGLLYRSVDRVSVGAVLTNVWRENNGGAALSWTTGEQEKLPRLLKIGCSYYPISNLLCALDSDIDLGDYGNAVMHGGTEWWVIPNLAFRLGFDQKLSSIDDDATGILTNFTAGIGFKEAGLRFDYAFMQDMTFSALSTHYFSIGYMPEGGEMVVPEETALQRYEKVIENK